MTERYTVTGETLNSIEARGVSDPGLVTLESRHDYPGIPDHLVIVKTETGATFIAQPEDLVPVQITGKTWADAIRYFEEKAEKLQIGIDQVKPTAYRRNNLISWKHAALAAAEELRAREHDDE